MLKVEILIRFFGLPFIAKPSDPLISLFGDNESIN